MQDSCCSCCFGDVFGAVFVLLWFCGLLLLFLLGAIFAAVVVLVGAIVGIVLVSGLVRLQLCRDAQLIVVVVLLFLLLLIFVAVDEDVVLVVVHSFGAFWRHVIVQASALMLWPSALRCIFQLFIFLLSRLKLFTL
jgi:hypothetical protein